MAGLPPLASVSDLAAWVGEDISKTDPRAGAVLRAASALVRDAAGQTWLDESGDLLDEELIPESAVMITVQAAARSWANPDGYASERLGDYSYQRSGDAESGVYLTATERSTLAGLRPSPRRIGTIATTRGDCLSVDAYTPVAGQSEPFLTGPV